MLCGNEDYLIDWAVSMLIEEYINPASKMLDLTVLEEGTYGFEEIKQACETLPMISQRKIVVAEGLHSIFGKPQKWFGKEDARSLLAYLPVVEKPALLILTANERLPRQDKFTESLNAINDAGKIYEMKKLSERDLKAFMTKRLSQKGKSMAPSVMNMMITESGYFNDEIDYGLYNLANDLEKAIIASDQNEIPRRIAAYSISDNLEHNVFKMIDFIAQKRKDEALICLHDLLVLGEQPDRLLAAICSQLELMLEVKELQKDGAGNAAMKKQLGVHEFRIKKAAAFSEHYSVDELKKMFFEAIKVDNEIKSGLLDKNLALELMIARI